VGGPVEDLGLVFVRVDAQFRRSMATGRRSARRKRARSTRAGIDVNQDVLRRYKVDTHPWTQLLHEPDH
jgi:hypothetical protein